MADKLLDDLMTISIEAEEAKTEWTRLKEETKEAKDRLDSLTDQILQRLKKRREEDADPDRLKFGDDETIPASAKVVDTGDIIDVDFTQPQLPGPVAEPSQIRSTTPNAFDADAWRSITAVDLTLFGLSDKTAQKLAEAGLGTVGAIADWSKSGKNLVDIPGVGEAKATEIEEALDAFWLDYRARQAPRAADTPKKSRKKTT